MSNDELLNKIERILNVTEEDCSGMCVFDEPCDAGVCTSRQFKDDLIERVKNIEDYLISIREDFKISKRLEGYIKHDSVRH